MATLQQLERALVAADRAGDSDAARKLAAAVRVARQDVGNLIPTEPTAAQAAAGARAPVAPAAVAPIPDTSGAGIVDTAIGTGEAVLATGTALTGGAVGMIGGTVKGLAEQLLSGEFGTAQAARAVEQAALQGAQLLTYAPRTPSGQAQTEAVGKVVQQAVPMTGLTAEMGALARGAAPVLPAARVAVAGAGDAALNAVRGRVNRPAAGDAAGAGAAPAAGAGAGAAGAVPPAQVAGVQPLPAEQLAATARAAGEGGIGSQRSARILAEQAAPDATRVAAGKRLGIDAFLQPDHVTTNEAYRQVVAAIKSNPQSKVALAERNGLASVAQRANELIDEIGGTSDLSALSQQVRTRLDDTVASLDGRAEALYEQVRAAVPAQAEAPAVNVLQFVRQRAADLGGAENLSTLEKSILRKLSPREAAGLVDDGPSAAPDVPTLADFAAKSRLTDGRAPKQQKSDFIKWVQSKGGIASREQRDITAEGPGVRSNPGGIFRRDGLGRDELARMAADEGYLLPDQAGDSRAFVDLVKRAVRGDAVFRMVDDGEAFGAEMAARGQREVADGLERRLMALGIDPGPARGRSAVMTEYLNRYEDALLSRASQRSGARAAEEGAAPLYEQLRQQARTIAQDVIDGPGTVRQFEADIRPLSPVMRRMVAEEVRRLGSDPGDLAPIGARAGSGGQPTYTLLDDVRRDVGSATRGRGVFKDEDSGLAKKLYALLSDDQAAVVERFGVKDVYDAARGAVAQRKAVEDDLAALFGKALDRTFVDRGAVGLRGAVGQLSRGDSAQLGRLLASVPDDMRQRVVASGLSTVFRKQSSALVTDALGNQVPAFDFTGYAKWYRGLRDNRQAYSAIAMNLPLSARKQLEALYRVSLGVSQAVNRQTKTGALGTIKAEMMGADTLMENLYSAAKRSGAGMAAEAITTPMGVPGAGMGAALASALTKGKPKSLQAIDELIASPEFEQLVRKAPGPKREAAVRRLVNSPAFKRALIAIGRPREIAIDPAGWINQALQQQAPALQQPQQKASIP